MQFEQNVPLAPFTTFRIGGPARWFATALQDEDVPHAVAFARQHSMPLFVLGGGSNLLVADEGYPGLVLHIAILGVEQRSNGSFAVGAGEDWDTFVSRAVAAGCAGIECLAGIPGSVGGTPVQNVGAYGQEVSETIEQVRAFDTQQDRFVDLSRDECQFAYRSSIFNGERRGRYIVTRVSFGLQPGGRPKVAYADLERYFGTDSKPTLREVSAAVRCIRAQKGMVLNGDDPDTRSAGSFFKNPVVAREIYDRIAQACPAQPVPHYPAPAGCVKLPAAWLLEQAGFTKGYTQGHAAISGKHTLALTNRGGASAADIGALRDEIVHRVQQRFGIRLEQEPVSLG